MSKAKWAEVLVNFWSSTDNYKRALQVFLHVSDSVHRPEWNMQASFLACVLLDHLQLVRRRSLTLSLCSMCSIPHSMSELLLALLKPAKMPMMLSEAFACSLANCIVL